MSKKALKKETKDAEKIILEENNDFYDNFMREHFPKKTFKNNFVTMFAQHKLCAAISASTVIVAVLTLVLCLVFLLPTAPIIPNNPIDPSVTIPDDKKHYLQENEIMVDSSIVELNANLSSIIFSIGDSFNILAKRTYDSISNDTLFYSISLTDDELKKITFYVYVNKDYEHKRINEENSTPALINGFELDCYAQTMLDDIIYSHTAKALMTYEGITVYIEYNEMSLDEESNFLEVLEQILHKA
jgi:hypothetical protein